MWVIFTPIFEWRQKQWTVRELDIMLQRIFLFEDIYMFPLKVIKRYAVMKKMEEFYDPR